VGARQRSRLFVTTAWAREEVSICLRARHSPARALASAPLTFGASFRPLRGLRLAVPPGARAPSAKRATPVRRRAHTRGSASSQAAQLVGMVRYAAKRLGGGPPEIIEYKTTWHVRPLHKSGDDLNEADREHSPSRTHSLGADLHRVLFRHAPERAALGRRARRASLPPRGCALQVLEPAAAHQGNIPYLAVLAGAVVRSPRAVFKLPKERWFLVLSVLLILGCVGTAFTNGDSLRYGKFKFVNIAASR